MAHWPMRQDPGQLTLCDERVLANPGDLAYAVLDGDDEWQLFSDEPGRMASVCLADVVERLPQLTALRSLHPEVAVDWDPDDREWRIGVLTPGGAAETRPEEAVRQWAAPAGLLRADPATLCFVTLDLVRFAPGEPDPFRFVFQIARGADAGLYCYGWEDESEGEEGTEIWLRDLVLMHPDVKEIVDRPLRRGEEFLRTPADRRWKRAG